MFDEDKVIPISLVGKRNVYSEAAVEKLIVQREKYRQLAVGFEDDLFVVTRDRDRLKKALVDISAEGEHARSGGTAYRMAVIARTVLTGSDR